MQKKLLAMSLSTILTIPGLAAASLIPQSILKNHLPSSPIQKKFASPDEYADFSGHWVGSCDTDPDEKIELNIEVAPDFSFVTIDNITYTIDSISMHSNQGNQILENNMVHLRWSPDGQQLLATMGSHYKVGNLSQGELDHVVGNAQLSINNKQLISNDTFTFFTDGVLSETLKVYCTFDRQPA